MSEDTKELLSDPFVEIEEPLDYDKFEEEDDRTEEDMEREIEFGRMEFLREEHFAALSRHDAKLKNKKVRYPHYDYMVEDIMPLNELHIVAGESGAGKSTWLLQMIDDWQHERPVLGKKSTWYPYVILVQDRTKAGVYRTLQRMKLNPEAFPIQTGLGGEKLTLKQKIQACLKANPNVKIFFVEGLHVGLADSNDYGATSAALQELIALCQKEQITIVATTHMSKENAKLGNSGRGAILGSNAAPAMSECNILLNKVSKKNVNRIKLTVHGRNDPEEAHYYKWGEGEQSGRLVPTDENDDMSRVEKFLNSLDTDVFKYEEMVEYYEKRFKVKRGSADLDKKQAVEQGLIKPVIDDQTGQIKKGYWQRVSAWGDLEA